MPANLIFRRPRGGKRTPRDSRALDRRGVSVQPARGGGDRGSAKTGPTPRRSEGLGDWRAGGRQRESLAISPRSARCWRRRPAIGGGGRGTGGGEWPPRGGGRCPTAGRTERRAGTGRWPRRHAALPQSTLQEDQGEAHGPRVLIFPEILRGRARRGGGRAPVPAGQDALRPPSEARGIGRRGADRGGLFVLRFPSYSASGVAVPDDAAAGLDVEPAGPSPPPFSARDAHVMSPRAEK